MLKGVLVIGKRFLVRNHALLGTCVGIDNNLNLILDTKLGLKSYSADDLIELVI